MDKKIKEDAKKLHKRITTEGWTIWVHTGILAFLNSIKESKSL